MCRHYWKLVGKKGGRWVQGHALARCVRCPAWTVVEYGEYKPCPHVTVRREEPRCGACGMPGEEPCRNCGS